MAKLKNVIFISPPVYDETKNNAPRLMLSISKASSCTHTIEPSLMPMSIVQPTSPNIPPTTFSSNSPPPKRQKMTTASHVELSDSSMTQFVPEKTTRIPGPNPKPTTSIAICEMKRAVSNALE